MSQENNFNALREKSHVYDYTHTHYFAAVNVSFMDTSYSISEGDGSFILLIYAEAGAGAPTEVTVIIIRNPGRDSTDFNISSNGKKQLLTFANINDNVLGNDRTFEVILTSSDLNVMIVSPSTATVNITEDDSKGNEIDRGQRSQIPLDMIMLWVYCIHWLLVLQFHHQFKVLGMKNINGGAHSCNG